MNLAVQDIGNEKTTPFEFSMYMNSAVGNEWKKKRNTSIRASVVDILKFYFFKAQINR